MGKPSPRHIEKLVTLQWHKHPESKLRIQGPRPSAELAPIPRNPVKPITGIMQEQGNGFQDAVLHSKTDRWKPEGNQERGEKGLPRLHAPPDVEPSEPDRAQAETMAGNLPNHPPLPPTLPRDAYA
jgi:hypothetical protein